jgi:hypothetical protein
VRRAVLVVPFVVLHACTLFNTREDYYDETASAAPQADAGSSDTDARTTDAGPGDAGYVPETTLPDRCTFTTPVHEFRNPETDARIYTLKAGEAPGVAGPAYTEYVGVAFRAAPGTGKNHLPVYQLYRPESGDRLYTINAGERDRVQQDGYVFEGIAFYGFGLKDECTVEILSLQRSGIHRLTPSPTERDTALAEGWKAEGGRFYAGPR